MANSTIVQGEKLLVVERPERATEFKFLECHVDSPDYASSQSVSKFYPKSGPLSGKMGQLVTGKGGQCLTVKDSSVSLETCAKSEGDQLLAQWMFVSEHFVAHAGKSSNPPGAEVILHNNTVATIQDFRPLKNYMGLGLLKPDDKGDPPIPSSDESGSSSTSSDGSTGSSGSNEGHRTGNSLWAIICAAAVTIFSAAF